MAVRTTFADLLGAIGPMMRAEAGGARFASSPLGDLALVSEDAPGATFSGYLDASHGELSALEWLSGNRFSLQGSKRGDGLFSIVARPPASATDLPKPALSPFAADLTFDRVEFCGKRADDSSGDAPIISFAQAVWKLGARSGNAEDALSAEVALPLLSGDAPLLSIGFFDAAGNPGTVLADASESLHDLLGVRIPFSRYVPSTVPFSNRMRLHRVMLAFNGPVLQARRNANPAQVRSLCLELGFDGADEPAALSNGFALNSVRLELSLPRNVKLSRATAAISADVEVAGVPLTVSASAPRFDIRGTTRFDRPVPLSTVAAKAGFAVPALLDGVSLAYVNLRTNLTESDYRAAFAIESAANAHEPFAFSRLDARLERADGVEGRLLGAQAELAGRGGSFSARLSAELAFQKSGKRVCGLGLRGDFGKETRLFGSLMAPFPSFGDVYEALAGASLPQGFPTVKLETLSATVLAGAAASVESFAAAVVLDVEASVFGTAFALRAALSHAPGRTQASGSFKLAERFDVDASLTVADAAPSWTFSLRLGSTSVAVAYQSAARRIQGTVTANVTLGDAAGALMRLFNWSASFDRTGAWSFLNDIGLKGTELVYDYAKAELSATVTPSVKVPFVEIASLRLVAGTQGVRFELAGTFDGVAYTPDKPLPIDPCDPPKPSGNALRVSYLALGSRIHVPGINVPSVPRALAALQRTLDKNTKPSDISVTAGGDVLLGADFEAAQAVRVQLVCYEATSFVGGRFELFGDKASPLKGLAAECSYVRVSPRVGAFSASFVPPVSLQRIRLGGMTLGVGQLSARVCTNGDFAIDLGFPEKCDFSRSFTLSYGVFSGSGGVRVSKAADAPAGSVPAAAHGRFSPVLQMGLGLRLALAKGVNAGILTASVSAAMQCLLEGVYATYLPDGGRASSSYYRVAAAATLDGRLSGGVNFGLVGASVSVAIATRFTLRVETGESAKVHAEAQVRAEASIKVWFVRLRFSFSLSVSLDFTLSDGGSAPWKGARGLADESALSATPTGAPPAPLYAVAAPTSPLRLPARRENGLITVPVRVVPIWSRSGGYPVAALVGLVTAERFVQVIEQVAAVLAENGYWGELGNAELFNGTRFFSRIDDLYRVLAEYFVFELAPGSSSCAEEGDVIMPLPDCLNVTIWTNYRNGARDKAERDLTSCFPIDEAYLEKLADYFARTSDDMGERAPYEGGRGLAAELFAGWFETAVKALRAVKASCELRGTPFNAAALTDEQASDVAGIVQRFYLSGRRAPRAFPDDETSASPLVSAFALAGTQLSLAVDDEGVDGFDFAIEAVEPFPWVSMEKGLPALEWSVARSEALAQLPALQFGAAVFAEEPRLEPSCTTVDASALVLPASFAVDGAPVFDGTGRLQPGATYRTVEAGLPRYAALLRLDVIRCADEQGVWEVVKATGLEDVESWCAAGAVETLTLMLWDDAGACASLSADGLCLVRGRALTDQENIPCTASVTAGSTRWLRVAATLRESQMRCYLVRQDGLELPWTGDEASLGILMGHASQEACPAGFPLVVRPAGSSAELELSTGGKVAQSSVEQGTTVVFARTTNTALDETGKALFDLYDGLAAAVGSANAPHAAQLETPPAAPRPGTPSDGETTRLYSLSVPYARALGADPYALVSADKDVALTLNWTDMLGNLLPVSASAGGVLAVRPRYHDDVVPFCGCSGMSASFCFQAVCAPPAAGVSAEEPSAGSLFFDYLVVRLVYEPPLSEGARHFEALATEAERASRQLLQPDVSVKLSTPLAGGVAVDLDKDAVRLLYDQVAAHPDDSHESELVVKLDDPPAVTVVELSVRIDVRRSADLVDPSAPSSALSAEIELPYLGSAEAERLRLHANECRAAWLNGSDAADVPLTLRHDFEETANFRFPYEADGKLYALETMGGFLVACGSEGPACLALRPLPLVSGAFSAGGRSMQAADADLQGVLDAFIDDLALVSEPATIASFCRDASTHAFAKRVLNLQLAAARALATRLAPLYLNAGREPDLAAARAAFVDAFLQVPEVDPLSVAVVQASVTQAMPASTGITVAGIVGEGKGLPCAVEPGSALLTAPLATDAAGAVVRLDSLALQVDCLIDGAGRRLTPVSHDDRFDRTTLGGVGSVTLPDRRRPRSPVLCSLECGASSTTASFSLSVAQGFTAELFYGDICSRGIGADLRAAAARTCPYPLGQDLSYEERVVSMERYRMEAPALIEVWDTASLSKLLDLMEEYVRALADFPDQAPPASALAARVEGAEADAVLLFAADDQGFLSSITLTGGTDVVSLSYCVGDSRAAVMERNGSTFSFASDLKPREEEPFTLHVKLSGDGTGLPRSGSLRLAYNPPRPADAPGKANPAFRQQTARIVF